MKLTTFVRSRRFVYSTCIVLLIASNAVILWKYMRLRSESAAARPMVNERSVAELISRPIETQSGESIVVSHLPVRYAVLFVFTPGDCASCLGELSMLNRIPGSRSDIIVLGLMAFANADEAAQTRRNFGLNFPVLIDSAGDITMTLGLPKTPWKIVVDVPSKRVVYEDPPSVTASDTEAFIGRVLRLGKK
jgi:peroxiredoxin